MSELSKQALKVDNNTSFPNNNGGLITPTILRTFNENMIDSMVDEIGYNVDSASWNQQIDALELFTASAAGLNTGSLLITASATNNVITFTKGDSSTFNVTVNTGSGEDISALNQATASLQAFTASANIRLNNLESTTASLNSSVSQLNANTASQQQSINSLNVATQSLQGQLTTIGGQSGSWVTESETGSFARTNTTNSFTETQTFTNVVVTGTASVALLNVLIESSSVIYSSGSNQFGDDADDVQTLYGSTRIVNELTASGLNYPTADNGDKSFLQTDGNGNLSLQYVESVYETIRNMSGATLPKGTPVYISGSTGDNGNAYPADASDLDKMPAVYIAGEDLGAGDVGLALVGGKIEGVNTTGFPAGTIIYVAEGGGWTDQRPSGSNSVVQVLGVVQFEGVGGQGVVINQLEAVLPNIQTGYAWVGNGSNQPVAIATSSFATLINTGSFATTGSNSFNGNQEITGSLRVTGQTFITPTTVSVNAKYPMVFISGSTISRDTDDSLTYNPSTNTLFVSASTGQTAISPNGITYTNVTSSITSVISKGLLSSIDSTGAPTTFKAIQISANPSVTQNPSLSTITNPSILTPSSSVGGFIAPIQFQDRSGYTDGRVTFTTPIIGLQGIQATGVNSFSGAIEFTGSAPSILSSSFSGSVITNLTDTYVDVPEVKQIVTLTSASYAALVTGGTVNPNTLYIVSGSTTTSLIDTGSFATTGSNTFIGNQIISGNVDIQSTLTSSLQQGYVWVGDVNGRTTTVATSSFGGGGGGFPYTGTASISGSLQVTGSLSTLPITLSVASSTASIDFTFGNNFILNIPTGSTTHIIPTNIIAGQTINLLLKQAAGATTGSVAWSPLVLFPSGYDMVATATGSAIDLVSMIAFDTTNVMAANVKNLK